MILHNENKFLFIEVKKRHLWNKYDSPTTVSTYLKQRKDSARKKVKCTVLTNIAIYYTWLLATHIYIYILSILTSFHLVHLHLIKKYDV